MSQFTRKNTGTVPQIQPPIAVFYGGPDVGKTTFAAGIPDSFFLMTEKGLGTNMAEHFQHEDGSPFIAPDMSVLWEQMQAMKTDDFADIRYIIVDTLTAMEQLIFTKVAADNDKSHIEDLGYGKGYQYALAYHQMVIAWAKEMQELGKGVIFLAHEDVVKFDSPDSQSYDRYQIKLHKAAFRYYHESSDIIGHCHMDSIIKTEEEGFNKEKTRAISRGKRLVRLQTTPAAIAKNRFQLPATMPLEWSAIHAGMIKSVTNLNERAATVAAETPTTEETT